MEWLYGDDNLAIMSASDNSTGYHFGLQLDRQTPKARVEYERMMEADCIVVTVMQMIKNILI